MKSRDIFVVVPVFNEARNIRRSIGAIRDVWPRIVVVDDGSSDNTFEILEEIDGIQIVKLEDNRGKGAAMKVGAKEAWKLGAKAVIFMDGDNQHNPKHIGEFVRVLKRGHDVVIGVRLLKTDIPWHRKVGNRLMSSLMRLLFRIDLPDMMCGYRALSKNAFKQIGWTSSNYGVEVEILTIIGRKNLPFKTLIVDTIYHDRYKGFSIWDGLGILLSLPYYRLKRI